MRALGAGWDAPGRGVRRRVGGHASKPAPQGNFCVVVALFPPVSECFGYFLSFSEIVVISYSFRESEEIPLILRRKLCFPSSQLLLIVK